MAQISPGATSVQPLAGLDTPLTLGGNRLIVIAGFSGFPAVPPWIWPATTGLSTPTHCVVAQTVFVAAFIVMLDEPLAPGSPGIPVASCSAALSVALNEE